MIEFRSETKLYGINTIKDEVGEYIHILYDENGIELLREADTGSAWTSSVDGMISYGKVMLRHYLTEHCHDTGSPRRLLKYDNVPLLGLVIDDGAINRQSHVKMIKGIRDAKQFVKFWIPRDTALLNYKGRLRELLMTIQETDGLGEHTRRFYNKKLTIMVEIVFSPQIINFKMRK